MNASMEVRGHFLPLSYSPSPPFSQAQTGPPAICQVSVSATTPATLAVSARLTTMFVDMWPPVKMVPHAPTWAPMPTAALAPLDTLVPTVTSTLMSVVLPPARTEEPAL